MSDLLSHDHPQVLRATGTTDVNASNSDTPSGKRSTLRNEISAAPCVASTTPCDDDDSTDTSTESCNSLPFADLSNIVRPDASQNENGTAGIRTQNQRIMSLALASQNLVM